MKLPSIWTALGGAAIGCLVGVIKDYENYLDATNTTVPKPQFDWRLSLLRSARGSILGLATTLALPNVGQS